MRSNITSYFNIILQYNQLNLIYESHQRSISIYYNHNQLNPYLYIIFETWDLLFCLVSFFIKNVKFLFNFIGIFPTYLWTIYKYQTEETNWSSLCHPYHNSVKANSLLRCMQYAATQRSFRLNCIMLSIQFIRTPKG